jgi:hypothetical protein
LHGWPFRVQILIKFFLCKYRDLQGPSNLFCDDLFALPDVIDKDASGAPNPEGSTSARGHPGSTVNRVSD